jgi:hypothetical protein
MTVVVDVVDCVVVVVVAKLLKIQIYRDEVGDKCKQSESKLPRQK